MFLSAWPFVACNVLIKLGWNLVACDDGLWICDAGLEYYSFIFITAVKFSLSHKDSNEDWACSEALTISPVRVL